MNTDFENIMAVVGGGSRDNFDIARVSDADRRQMMFALENLFTGLSLQNWMNGGKLLDAWHESVRQMREMIFEITDMNPAVLFLRQAVFASDSKWIKIIQTGSVSINEIFTCRPESRNEYAERATMQINDALAIIADKVAAYAGASACLSQTDKIATLGQGRATHQMTREKDRDRERK